MAWPDKKSERELPVRGGRVSRWCKRCGCRRHFNVRRKPDGRRQVDCVACSRRRGRQRSPTYVTWKCMKERCLNPNAWNYPYYGGKGVKVHPPWARSFQAFLRDVGERPAHKTLDRIDPDGDYVPGNVRWASPKDQIANRFVSYTQKRKDNKL